MVYDKNILATGYNGVPTGIEHCTRENCLRIKFNVPSGERHELCRGLHAEQNAILQAAKHGTSIEGSTLYITTTPCNICLKMILNAGIKRLVVDQATQYPDKLALTLLLAVTVNSETTGKYTIIDLK